MSKSQTASVDITEMTEVYHSLIETVENADEDDLAGRLIWRDAIAEALEAGTRLSAKDRACLEAADRILREKAATVYANNPEVFDDNRDRVPEGYWWWKLGPEGAPAAD